MVSNDPTYIFDILMVMNIQYFMHKKIIDYEHFLIFIHIYQLVIPRSLKWYSLLLIYSHKFLAIFVKIGCE